MTKKKGKMIEIGMEMEKMPPMLHLDDDDVIDGVNVGDEVTRNMKLKLSGMDESERDGKKRKSQRFEVMGIVKPKKVNIDMEDFARKAQNTNG